MTKKFLLESHRFMLCFLGLFSFFFIGSGYAQLARKSTATSANGAEISAFCPATSRLFTVAGNAIEYYTLNSAGVLSSPTVIPYGLTLAAGTTAIPNSVAVKNGIVAFGFAIVGANNAQLPGKVAFYDPLTTNYISDVTVGYLPDMIAFSPDGTKILTANEGEPNSYNQATSFDPEGSVSIIDISAGIASATVTEASFTSFDSQMTALKAAGVRIYGPNATVAQDLEPEYVTFVDNVTAAVTLQENNAVAIVNIATGTVTNIYPLGLKDHNIAGNGFDASDREISSNQGRINIQTWPVKGMYMPDAIASFTSGGNTYFITANEGDSRAYTGYSEEIRVGATTGYTLDPTVFPNATTLKLNANLGRLQLSNASGDIDGDGDFDEIHALGARSFTIWNNTFTKVFDSGDQLEQITATQNAAGFNSDGTAASFDSRSDNKGPEPEGVTTGTVNGVPYAFVGSERTGDVFMYDISNPAAPVFKQYINTAADTGVEGIIFVPAAQSPTGNALVITSAETSRTISVYEFTPPSVNLAVSTNTASETAGTVVTVTATASEPVFGNKTVSVAVSGTNISAADYTLSNATITIPSGSTTGSVTFTVLNDNAVEPLETATLTISNPSSGIALGTTTSQNIAISDFAFTLQILHASDFEGAVEAVQDAPRFAAIVDVLEDTYTNTIKLSSGDNYIPGPFLSSGEDSSLSAALKTSYESYYNTTFSSSAVNLLPSIGRADISILNFIGIEASALGNHEFDLGTTEVRNIIRGANSSTTVRSWFGAQFPYLSSNLNFSGDSNLSAIATTDRLRLNTTFSSNPSEAVSTITNKTKLAPSTIIMKGGQKIGIVGATTQVLASISSPGATTVVGGGANNMNILAGIIQPVVNSLIADGCNKIILLSHLQQIAFEKELAGKLTGVDIIMAGGSNTLMADANDRLRAGDLAAESYPFLTTGLDGKALALINTDGNYKYVGRLVVDFDADGTLIPSSINPVISGVYAADAQGLNDVWGSNVANAYAVGTRGYQVQLLCNAIGNVISVKDGNLFGKTSVFLEGQRNFVRTQETNLGNVSAEANLWMAKFYDPTTVISIKNGGGIRSSIGNVIAVGDNVTYAPPIANPSASKLAGDISQLDIENSLRFNNQLSLVTLTASGLRSILENAVAATTATATPGQFAQVAGVRYSYNFSLTAGSRILNAVVTDAAGNVIDTLVVNGVTVGNLSRTFRVVTLNFLAGGGDGYPFATLGTSRVDLNTLPAQGPSAASFTNAGSEQDAFAEYMKNQYGTTPYGISDTPLTQDCRIQRVPARADNVLPPNAGTNGTVTICNNSAVVTAAQLFAALGGTPAAGGTWSPALAGAGVYTYTVTSPSCAGSASAMVTVTTTDLAASATAGTIACFGGTTTVVVSATGGTAPYTGTGTFTVSAGNYTYTVTDANGCTSTVSGTVSQPNELTNTATITACDSYTWSVNNQTYTTGGTYTVVDTNVAGCTNTNILVLTITNETITSQPLAPFICNVLGATTSISVATSTSNPGYVWQSRVVNATTPNPAWTNMTNNASHSGVNTAMLTITRSSSAFAAGLQYRVLVNGSCGQLTSNAVSLTVISAVRAGTISSAASVCVGGTTTFTLTGYAGTSIQWQSAPSHSTTAPGVFTNISGATSNVLTITGATLGMDKAYRAIVNSNCSNTTASTAVKLIKVDATTVAGTVTGGGTICSGGSGTLRITGNVGRIQWEYSTDGGTTYNNAPALAQGQPTSFITTSASSNSTTYIANNITQNLYFRARVVNGACLTQFTNAVQFTINTQATVGAVSALASSPICTGTGTTLNLTGTNVGTISWQRKSLTAVAWSAIYYANGTSIATGNLTASTMYRASVTIGSCSTVLSNEVTVAVAAAPLARTVTSNVTSPSGTTAATALCTSFNVAKTLTIGAGSIGTIQWQRSTASATSGFVAIAGATGSSYTISEATIGQNWYRAVFTNSCGVMVNGTAVSLWYKGCSTAKTVSENENAIVKSFDVKAYPNPYSESFNLSLTTSSQERVGIKVYDMTGKLVDSKEGAADEMANLQVGNNYQSGIYNVIVTQGNEVKTLRVIKR